MQDFEILKGKSILAVDDEPDVLDVVKEQLLMCQVTTATNYETARNFINTKRFDLVLLDIMGVDGFALLEVCREKNLPAAILTAHAISVESVNRASRLGAVTFLPKDELANLPELVAEVLTLVREGKSHWRRLFQRLGPFFKERLGLSWEDLEKPRNPPYLY
jgi:DNA-binding response OmpR family regulator